MDQDGFYFIYFIVDRAKDLVIRGRYNVYPREVRFVGELPKGPSGKILKSVLRDG
jgi:acyl-CoA synthetase (AMP-forming)/AMP-acid ligase II